MPIRYEQKVNRKFDISLHSSDCDVNQEWVGNIKAESETSEIRLLAEDSSDK